VSRRLAVKVDGTERIVEIGDDDGAVRVDGQPVDVR
jgi:hypothetical protein